MELEASFELGIYGKNNNAQIVTQIYILEILRQNGWEFGTSGIKTFLPINDNGMFNWQHEKITDDELFKIFQIQSNLKEHIGADITWDNGKFRTLLGLTPNLSLYFIVGNNDRPINTYGITDFNWFLSRIIPLLKNNTHIGIQYIKFTEQT